MSKISLLKNRFFPTFYEHDAPRLIDFLGAYLEWMEDEGNPYWLIDHVVDVSTVDCTVDMFFEHLKNMLMKDFPIQVAGDIKYIMKNLVTLYKAKGTQDAFKFFFRAAYNSFCDITFPKDKVLKASDGVWKQGYYVHTTDIPLNDMNQYNSMTVERIGDGMTGIISDITPHYFKGDATLKYSFNIIDNVKPFNIGDRVRILGTVPEVQFTINQSEYTTGYWEGTRGMLDSDYVLQDSYYYQNFSYEITSLVSYNEYKDIVSKLLNPSGMKFFGKIKLYEDIVELVKTPTTFLHWWIIHIFMGIYALQIQMEYYNFRSKQFINGYTNYYSPDWQLYYKDFNTVEHYETMTPIQLSTWNNASAKLVFDTATGKLINPDWVHERIDVQQYIVGGIEPQQERLILECVDGTITTTPWTAYPRVFCFIDGVKVRSDYIHQTATGYTLSGPWTTYTGFVTLYFPIITPKHIIAKDVVEGETIKFPANSNRFYIFPYIDGVMIRKNLYNDEYRCPKAGYLECYIYAPHDLCFINNYKTSDDTLLAYYKLKIKYV